jgi:hypothetical protein
MKLKKLMIAVLAIGVAVYGGFLIKKTFFEKGYANKEDAKETLLSYYVISLGLPDTKANRDKYRGMTLEQLKKELNLNDIIVE